VFDSAKVSSGPGPTQCFLFAVNPLPVQMIYVLENLEGMRMEWESTGSGTQQDDLAEPAVSLRVIVTL